MKDIAAEAQHRLIGYLRGGRVHPAIVLAGPASPAKYQIAKNMAKFLLCRKRGAAAFCGECSPCRRVEKEVHPDVLILHEEGEDTIKIDSVRHACHQMEISALEGGVKICIIDECHRMTSASANAFLKTLEEPGENRYFWLLTSQPGALLPTILSRCLQFRIQKIADGAEQGEKEFSRLLTEFCELQSVTPLVQALSDKEKCLDFIKFLQGQLRGSLLAPYLGGNPPPPLATQTAVSSLGKFDGLLELEGRLRSNANYGLLLESYLRKNWQ